MVLYPHRLGRYCCSMDRKQDYRAKGRRHVEDARLLLDAVRPKDDEVPKPRSRQRCVEVVNHQGDVVRVPQTLSPLLHGRRPREARLPYRDEPAHVA